MTSNARIKNIYLTKAGRYRVQVKYDGKLVEGGTFRYLKDAIQKLDELNEQYPRHMYKEDEKNDKSGSSLRI